MKGPEVTVIVLCWNGIEDTVECLRSLEEVEYSGTRLVVVDNGSTDSTAEIVRSAFPDVEVIETGENLGYAVGNNVGIVHALESGADAVLLLNNDTVVDQRFLRPMLELLYSSETVGAVNPTIYFHTEPRLIWSAGGRVEPATGIAHQEHYGEIDVGQIREPVELVYGVGTALLIKREALEATGYLDRHFYLYYEETDWCCRARDAGYTTMLAPSARVWHKISRSIREGTPPQIYYLTRNRLLFLKKRGASKAAILSVIRGLLRMSAVMTLRGRSRQGLAVLRGVKDFCTGHFGRAVG